MTDFTVAFEILGTIALIVAPTIVLAWLLAGSDGPGLVDIFAVPAGPPLPRGVQEEEPVRYRVERLSRPGTRPVVGDQRALTGRPAVEAGPCA